MLDEPDNANLSILERLRANALRHLAPYNIPTEILDKAIETVIGTYALDQIEARDRASVFTT